MRENHTIKINATLHEVTIIKLWGCVEKLLIVGKVSCKNDGCIKPFTTQETGSSG